MNVKIRKTIAYIFIIAFIISAIILVFYTAGFRYDSKKGTVIRTGSIILQTEPTNAKVSLNNQLLSTKTPGRINNVLPGEYTIKIEKENYFPWEKKLSVQSQIAIFAEDINLFYKTEPTTLLENIQWWNYSPTKNFVITSINEFNQQNFYLYNLSNGKKHLVFVNKNGSVEPIITWSKQNSFFVFQTSNISQVISTTYPPNTYNLNLTYKNLHWDDSKDNVLYYQKDNTIYTANFLNNKNTKIFELPMNATLEDYYIYDNQIFVIEKISKKYLLTAYPIDEGKNNLRKTIELNGDYFSIDNIVNQKIVLFNTVNNHFYLTDTSLDKVTFNQQAVTSYDILPDENLILIQTHEEIKNFNLGDNPANPKTLLRISQGLSKAQWFKNTNYCFYLDNGQLKIIELDDRNGNLIIDLITDEIQDFSLSPKNEGLYYIQNEKLLYLPIQK